MNKQGFTLYVTLIYVLLLTSMINILINHLQITNHVPLIFQQVETRGIENAELLYCVDKKDCSKKKLFTANKSEIIKQISQIKDLTTNSETIDMIYEQVISIKGEDNLWIIKDEQDLVLGEDSKIILRMLRE